MSTVIHRDDALRIVAMNVNRLLKDRNWSVRELARRSENTPMAISRLTREENMPAGDVLARISEAFDVAIDDLFNPAFRPEKIPA